MKENNNNNNNNNQSTQIIATVLAIAILIVAVVGISFAAFTYTGTGTKENIVTTGSITMTYSEPNPAIGIENAMPISDEVGKAFTSNDLNSSVDTTGKAGSISNNAAGVFDFTVNAQITGSATISYDIVGFKESGSTLDNTAAKIYLEKSTTGSTGGYTAVSEATSASKVVTFTEGTNDGYTAAGKAAHTSSTPAMLLHKDTITGNNTTHYYRLRMWVANDYDMSGTTGATAKTFKVRINVYGEILNS